MTAANIEDGSALRPGSPEQADSEPPLDRLKEELLKHIEHLEAELERYRSQDQLVSKALLAGTAYATRIREEARREADAVLHKASARARARLAEVEREQRHAEREVLRLRKLAEDLQAGLSGFLTTMVSRLDEEDLDGAPPADSAPETPPHEAPPEGGFEYASAPAYRATDAEPDSQ